MIKYQLRKKSEVTEKILCETNKLEKITQNPTYEDFDRKDYYIAKVKVHKKRIEIIDKLKF